jgi:predicted ATP-dependent endonuclease of OLD family
MQLTSLKIKNFRSLKNIRINFDRLSVLIGENDAGKSSVLDLLEMALDSKLKPDDNDFFVWEEEIGEGDGKTVTFHPTTYILTILEFALDEDDHEAQEYAVNNVLKIAKIWKRDTVSSYYRCSQAANPDLTKDFSKLKKAELEVIIQSIDATALQNLKTNEEKANWLELQAQVAPKKAKWVQAPTKWGNFLPRFDRYKALDYADPKSIVMKTLRQVYEQAIYEDIVDENGNTIKQLDKRLSQVKTEAETKIKLKVHELYDFMNRYVPRIKDVSFDNTIAKIS